MLGKWKLLSSVQLLSHLRLFETPRSAACQAFLSITNSRSSLSSSVMSNSLQLHRLYRPWNSPSQNTGVGSLFLLLGIFPTQGSNPGLPHCRQIHYQLSYQGSPQKAKVTQSCLTVCNLGRNSPGQNTGVGCHSLLQGIFPTQGLNPGVPHCRRILYQLSLKFVRFFFFLQCF